MLLIINSEKQAMKYFPSSSLTLLATALAVSSLSLSVRASSPAHSGIYAVADSAEVAATNPAGMTRLEGTHKTTSAIIALGFGEFKVDKDKTSVDGGDPDNDLFPVAVPGF
jgi:long-subunit fatty acid transport protein